MAKKRILAISHGQEASGFSRVAFGILSHVSALYDVHQLCLFAVPGSGTANWTRHYCKDSNDIYGLDEIVRLLPELRPDLIFIIHDLWIVPGYLDVVDAALPDCKTVAYCPLDGSLSRPEVVFPLRALDCLVTYVDSAKNEIEAAFRKMLRDGEIDTPCLRVIPHGIDTGRFFPLPEAQGKAGRAAARVNARRQLFPRQSDLDDAFIILNANRNQARKRLDITIEAFAEFARDKPDNVKLYLHTAAVGACPDVRAEAVRCGIGGRLIMTAEDGDRHPAVSDDLLNLIYNACDAGVNTSSGEGWGLVSFEHGATGAAQVVPGHSACAGLWEGSALVVEATPVRKLTRMPLRTSEVCAVDVASAFEQLYSDGALLDRLGVAAQANAGKRSLSWPVVGAQWHSVFEQVLQ